MTTGLTGKFRRRTIVSIKIFPLSFTKEIAEVEIRYPFENRDRKKGFCTTWREATDSDKNELII